MRSDAAAIRESDLVRQAPERATMAASPRPAWLRLLLPLESGPAEIRALDGLRAVAALMIVAFHLMLLNHVEYQAWSRSLNSFWYVLSTGVQLFFTLSGFLLFRPYVAALLKGGPLPPTVRFYQKRALRILPAYWVALALLFFYNWQIAKSPVWLNLAIHAAFLHDFVPSFNRDLDGPFWTLAVEAQFYLALPWIAAALAWITGHTRRGSERRAQTPRRVIVTLVGMIVGALVVRMVGLQIMSMLPTTGTSGGGAAAVFFWLGLLLIGMQGKYLEVFLVGAIAATLYTATTRRRATQAADGAPRDGRLARIALGLAAGGLVIMVPCAMFWQFGTMLYVPASSWGWDTLLYPLATGVGYSAILLSLVWGGPWLRAFFELAPLRFVGHISYSLYIWHQPILHAKLPFLQPFPLWARVVMVFIWAYLSYQLVERPFLNRRRKLNAAASRAG